MYSVVMLAAMTAAPESPEFCGFFRRLCHRNECYSGCGYGYRPGCGSGCGYGSGGGGCGYGSGCGYGGSRCFFTGCGLFGRRCRQPQYPQFETCGAAPYQAYQGYQASPTDHQAPIQGVIPAADGNTLPIPQSSMIPANQAQILVVVPADAKLYANDHLTTESGGRRVLTTPVISAGEDHHYTLKVEYTLNGESRIASKQIVVRGGMVSKADFTAIDADKTTSAVSVNLPENSKLFIDGQEAISKGGLRNFNTSEMAKDQKFSWSVRVESELDGKTVVESRQVSFKAGEPLSLDFVAKPTVETASAK